MTGYFIIGVFVGYALGFGSLILISAYIRLKNKRREVRKGLTIAWIAGGTNTSSATVSRLLEVAKIKDPWKAKLAWNNAQVYYGVFEKPRYF